MPALSRTAFASDRSRREPPIAGSPLSGVWRRFRHEPLALMTEATRRHGDVVQFAMGPMRVYLLAAPRHVQHVFVDHLRNYSKQTRGYDAMRAFLGDGLVTSEGDFWKRQRRIAQPAFHRNRIAGFADTMSQASQQMVQRWNDDAKLGRVVDVHASMTELTMWIVSRTLLGSDVDDHNHVVAHAVERMNGMARDMMTNPFYPPLWIPTPRNREFRKLGKQLDDIILGAIETRRRSGEDTGDLLSMFMHAQDEESGERMNDQQLRDEVMTMFLAGHETTANALTWAFYLLSTHPEVRRRLQAELDEVLGGRAPTFEDLPKLEYTKMVIYETMRLYPPAWSIGRRAEEEDEIDGFRIRRHGLVIASPWVTHRHPHYWPNPEGFDPERFAEGPPKKPRYAYFPFGAGARLCIGMNFALMEAQIVLASLAQRFDANLVPGQRIEPAAYITLRPAQGLPMSLVERRP